MTEQLTYKREPAKRIFASEFRGVKFSEKFSSDDKAPTFILSPTGEIAMRLLIVGVLTDKERATTKNQSNTIYKGRVNDGTGEFFVSASNFQPEAMMQMARIETPAIVSVIGKPKLFTREDGNHFVSVNIESITVTDKETRDMWKLETAAATLARIEMMEKGEVKSAKNIKEKYNTNLEIYKGVVNKALTRSV
jgi:RPA family protein